MLFLLFDVFFRPAGVRFADGGGRNEPRASCSPPRWGGGELRAGVTPVLRKAHRYSGRGLRGSRNERMRIAGLRGAEAAARTVLRTAILQNLSSAAAGGGTKGASRRR